MIRYARMAVDLSSTLNDPKKQVRSLTLLAEGYLQKGLPIDGINCYRQVMDIAIRLNNDFMRASALRGIGQCLWYQGYYEKAIDTIELAIPYFRDQNRVTEISDARVITSSIYGDQGNYVRAFEEAQQALELSIKYSDQFNIILSLVQIGKLYLSTGDVSAAREYFIKGYQHDPPEGQWVFRHLAHSMGDLFKELEMFDSALHYYRLSFSGNPESRLSKLKMGKYYLSQKMYDSSFYYFKGLYTEIDKSGEGHILYDAMLGMSEIYFLRKDYQNALMFANTVAEMATLKKARLTQQSASELLSKIYTSTQQPEKALSYFRQHVALKDSILSDQLKGRLSEFRRVIDDEKRMAQIALLKKEKLLTTQQLRSNRIQRNLLMGGLLIFACLSGIIVWNISLKRKNEKLRNESSRSEWERIATDLEMQALRAQMNPHFIFNCLSSINRFILKNEADRASDYLTRFSRLIRMVLINSQKDVISLEDEIDTLRLYIEMEQLRFRNHFNYSIILNNDIKPGAISIPPLILQPFCENAIWHGLMHKQTPGELIISFSMKDETLECTITDNGIGRKHAEFIKQNSGEDRKSLGLKLTAERLALYNGTNGFTTTYSIRDIVDERGEAAGTTVVLQIKVSGEQTKNSRLA